MILARLWLLAAALGAAPALPPVEALRAGPGDDVRADARHRVWSTRTEPGAAATLRMALDGTERVGQIEIAVRVQRHPAVLEVALVDGAGVVFRAESRTLAGHGAADTWTVAPADLRDARGAPWTAGPAVELLLVDRTGERTADRGEQVLAVGRLEVR